MTAVLLALAVAVPPPELPRCRPVADGWHCPEVTLVALVARAESLKLEAALCLADAARDAAHAQAEAARLTAQLASADARIRELEARPLPWAWVAAGVAAGIVLGAWVAR
jgi:hypothetical protein